MKKRYRFALFAPVSLGLALIFTLTPALADKSREDKEQDTETTEQDDIKNLDTMVVIGEAIDPPFHSKTFFVPIWAWSTTVRNC
ncbi:MAG: hypothetical protein Q7U38_11565 [Methylobacter sp.]|nr:hypothetical protein [Methylobacter sp.]